MRKLDASCLYALWSVQNVFFFDLVCNGSIWIRRAIFLFYYSWFYSIKLPFGSWNFWFNVQLCTWTKLIREENSRFTVHCSCCELIYRMFPFYVKENQCLLLLSSWNFRHQHAHLSCIRYYFITRNIFLNSFFDSLIFFPSSALQSTRSVFQDDNKWNKEIFSVEHRTLNSHWIKFSKKNKSNFANRIKEIKSVQKRNG